LQFKPGYIEGPNDKVFKESSDVSFRPESPKDLPPRIFSLSPPQLQQYGGGLIPSDSLDVGSSSATEYLGEFPEDFGNILEALRANERLSTNSDSISPSINSQTNNRGKGLSINTIRVRSATDNLMRSQTPPGYQRPYSAGPSHYTSGAFFPDKTRSVDNGQPYPVDEQDFSGIHAFDYRYPSLSQNTQYAVPQIDTDFRSYNRSIPNYSNLNALAALDLNSQVGLSLQERQQFPMNEFPQYSPDIIPEQAKHTNFETKQDQRFEFHNYDARNWTKR
jgi:hypothetical protein